MKKINLLILIMTSIIFPQIVSAESSYKINNYELEITLNNKNYEYKENVDVSFDNPNISLRKELPYTIKDLDINTNYYLETNYNKTIEIKSGLSAKKNFELTYSDKPLSPKKDVYIFELSNTYNNILNNITLTINVPNSFNEHNLSFYLNNDKLDNIDYKINENTLTIEYPSLKEKEILKVELDYGKLYLNNLTLTSIIVSIVLSIISYILWYLYGKDFRLPIKKTSKFSSKLTPLDISLINNGKVIEDDSFYLLLSLANKGYINIVEDGTNNFTLIRNKDYDGKNYKETYFIKSLFRKSESVTLAEYMNIVSEKKKTSTPKKLEKEISSNDLYRRFHIASKNILSIINTNEEKDKYFEPKPDQLKILLVLAITIILVIVTSLPFIEIKKLYLLPLGVIFSITTLFILMSLIENIDIKKKKTKLISLAILSVLAILILLTPSFRRNRIYLIAYLISCISVLFILILYKYMPKRTLYGTKQYVNIEGFKLFIQELSNKELDPLLELNPNYLYDILPYAYMLEVHENVLKKLKEYNIKEPSWYTIKDKFTFQKLHNSINRLKAFLENRDEE